MTDDHDVAVITPLATIQNRLINSCLLLKPPDHYFFIIVISQLLIDVTDVCTTYSVINYYFINFVEGVNPLVSEAHCWCTSFHKYVITI